MSTNTKAETYRLAIIMYSTLPHCPCLQSSGCYISSKRSFFCSRCIRRRRRRRRQADTFMFVAILLLVTTEQANSFRHMEHEDDVGGRPKRRHFLRSLAESGASKWGDYIPSTKGKSSSSRTMKKTSSLYVAQLHQKMQMMQSNNNTSIDISDLKQRLKFSEEKENFTQEILIYMLGGAVAGSAFAAATAGAFFGTAIIALGAIATAFFTDEDEEDMGSYLNFMLDEGTERLHSLNEEEHTVGIDSCDYDGEEQKQLPETTKESPEHKVDSSMLEELKRCYNGIPEPATLDFSQYHSKDDVCIVDGIENDTVLLRDHDTDVGTDADENTQVTAAAIEYACQSTEICDEVTPTVNIKVKEQDSPKRVNVVWHDSFNDADDAHGYAKTTIERIERLKRSQPQRAALSKPRRKSRVDEQLSPEHWAILTDAERDGALLLAESLRVASGAFGLVGDAVRFAGETAAATAGGAARLAGGAVRVTGWAVGSLGEAIEKGGGGRDNGDELLASDKKKTRKRQVAGTSVRLVGDAIEQVADSLLLAGSATERIAFAAAGAAEGTVRIVEDFASSLSDLFSKEGREGTKPSHLSEKIPVIAKSAYVDQLWPNFMAEEAMHCDGKDVDSDVEEVLADAVAAQSDEGALIDFFHLITSLVDQNKAIISAEIAGVPSLAPDLLGIFLLCFLASVLILAPKKEKIESVETIVGGSPREDGVKPQDIKITNADDHDCHSTLTVESTMKVGRDGARGRPSLAERAISLLFLPLRLVRSILLWSWRIIISKRTLLLIIHLLGWVFLSRTAQYKSSIIQSKSELNGYHLAVQSIGQSSLSIKESAVWLNAILSKLWRVDSGGLEPLLSSSASASLAESLEHPISKPSVVAHVALESFSFGSSPPIFSNIEITGIDDDQSAVYMKVDMGMLLHDAVLLLDIKPSSLEYKSLPPARLSVNSLDAKACIAVSVKCSPDYPYIPFLNISLTEIPDFHVKIEAQSESGLNGIDFGSFPVVSKWIKAGISNALAEYLLPQYISIDILAWLRGEDKIVRYFGLQELPDEVG